MPTQPVMSLLNREIAEARFGKTTLLLQECINYATRVLDNALQSDSYDEDRDFAVLFLYLHVIEMLDGIEVLASHGASSPARLLLRSAWEAVLSIEYIGSEERQYTQRSYAWYVADLHNRLDYLESHDPSTQRGSEFKQILENEFAGSSNQIMLGHDLLSRLITEYHNALADPKLRSIDTEYRRVKGKGTTPPNWFQLFGGPSSIRKLAKQLQHEVEYADFYGPASTVVHARESARFLKHTPEGDVKLKSLRSAVAPAEVAGLAIVFMLRATRLILKRLLPEQWDAHVAWYKREVQDRLPNDAS